MFTEVLMSALNTPEGMLSAPADLLFFRDLIAFSTSALLRYYIWVCRTQEKALRLENFLTFQHSFGAC